MFQHCDQMVKRSGNLRVNITQASEKNRAPEGQHRCQVSGKERLC